MCLLPPPWLPHPHLPPSILPATCRLPASNNTAPRARVLLCTHALQEGQENRGTDRRGVAWLWRARRALPCSGGMTFTTSAASTSTFLYLFSLATWQAGGICALHAAASQSPTCSHTACHAYHLLHPASSLSDPQFPLSTSLSLPPP